MRPGPRLGLESKLAWRNVWRNPRRTALTVAATVFAVVLVVFSVAMAAGVHEKMIDDTVRVRSGHVTLTGPGYLEELTLDHHLRLDAATRSVLESTPGVDGYAPRMVSFGLLSEASATRGVLVIGVDPDREEGVTSLPTYLRAGRFLRGAAQRPMVLGERLAKFLSVDIGDRVLLYSVAYSLESAYDLFEVTGIMRLPEAQMDRSLAVIDLIDAQSFFVFGDRISEIAVLASEVDAVPSLVLSLRTRLDISKIEVHPWQDVMPELEQILFLDDAGMYIMLLILVIVVAFGILNTILMAVLERQRELGVVLALGLSPASVFRMVYLESLLLAGLGLVAGLAIAIPLVLYFQAHPITLSGDMAQVTELFGFEPMIVWKLKVMNPIGSTLTILGVAIVTALYPALKASRGRPVDVLRSL
ncbi:MAG: ABC transporter permease [Deltaproteobacteria bacterium]|nr:ABC transporter permease [Deltaproteobacteria bacterium]